MDFFPAEQSVGVKFCTVVSDSLPCVFLHFGDDIPRASARPKKRHRVGLLTPQRPIWLQTSWKW